MTNLSLVNCFKALLVGAAVFALSGCEATSTTDFPVSAEDQAEITDDSINIVRLTPQNIASYKSFKAFRHGHTSLAASTAEWRYLVGVGDILSITVWDHPELTLPAGPQRSQIEAGSPVNARGEIFYPFINHIMVAGHSVSEVQRVLTEKLSEFIPDPQIEVKVAAFNAQKAVVTGAVGSPGSISITNIPLTLIEAVNRAGGLGPTSDSSHVTIQRNGRTNYVHLHDFLTSGRADGNPVLQGGGYRQYPGI